MRTALAAQQICLNFFLLFVYLLCYDDVDDDDLSSMKYFVVALVVVFLCDFHDHDEFIDLFFHFERSRRRREYIIMP